MIHSHCQGMHVLNGVQASIHIITQIIYLPLPLPHKEEKAWLRLHKTKESY